MRHREVVKERMLDGSIVPPYDLFSCWEDDMLVGERNVDRFLRLSGTLEALAEEARELGGGSGDGAVGDDFKSSLSRAQMLRRIPGFIRVE
mmetsp:Transcript_8245/g.24775  ORF Transcript_8245/g.24775 Transcript_8245/m.24775 type:complete len:91 (-) Transcript_8245:1531-1803(-)